MFVGRRGRMSQLKQRANSPVLHLLVPFRPSVQVMPTCTGKGALFYPVCRFKCESHPGTPSQAHGEVLSQLCAYPLPQSSWCIKCTITTQQSPQICIFARNGCTAPQLALANTSCLLRCCFWSCVLCTPRKGEYFKHSVHRKVTVIGGTS